MSIGTQPLATLICLTAGVLPAATSLDERITQAAAQTYNFRVVLRDDTIIVQSRNGHVTLSGAVAGAQHRSLAEETVANLPGVQSVDNRLTLQGTAPAENSDPWLVMKVRTALLFQRHVDPANTQVAAADGVVTLSGTAANLAQKELTEEVVAGVDGVRTVVNQIKVVAASGPAAKSLAERVDDASITAQVKASLLFHRSTRTLATRVKTDRGVVTIRGEAKNGAERELVSRLVNDLRGVKRVRNLMTIQS